MGGCKTYFVGEVKAIWWPASNPAGTAEEVHKKVGNNVVVLLTFETFHGKTYTNGFLLNGSNERLLNGLQTGHQAV